MRPLRLTLQAFGPFAGREVIDFSHAMDAGVFGIYGKTGAGKTSLFDGIAFALFGESAGNERKAADMISDYKRIETLTEVELVFDLGDRRYVVHRIPDQMRKAKRGDRETSQKHEAYLFDATGLSLDEISSDNRGAVIAEKKVSTVDTEVSRLLGYDAAQFRQIVLLPQGEFRKILTASSDERSTILRRLFDVSVYEALTLRLREQATEVRRNIETKRSERSTILVHEGCESEEALAERIAEGTATQTAFETEIATLQTALERHQKALTQGETLDTRFSQLGQTQSELANLNADAPRIAGIQQRLHKASSARGVLPVEEAFRKAQRALKDVETRLSEADKTHAQATDAHRVAKTRLQQEMDKEPLRLTKANQIAELTQFLNQLNDANLLKAPADIAQTSLDEAVRTKDAAAKAHQTAETLLAKLKGDRQAAAEHLVETQKTETEYNRLEQETAKAKTYEGAVADRDTILKSVTEATLEHQKAAQNRQAALQRLEQAEAELSEIQAIHLAHNLKSGEPCPVCGSVEHPKLATGDRTSAGRDDQFDSAKLSLDAAIQVEQKSSLKLTSETTRLEEREAALAKLSKASRPYNELIDQLNRCNGHLEALRSNSQFENLEHRIANGEEKTAQRQRHLDEMRSHLADAQSGHAVATSQYAKALDAIPEELRPEGLITVRKSELSQELNALEAAHKQAIELERARSEAAASINAERKTLVREQTRQQNSCQEDLESYEVALSKVSMTNAEFQMVKPDVASIAAFEAEIQEHQQKQATTADRIKRLSSEIGDAKRPDLNAMKDTVGAARQTLGQKTREAAAHASSLKRLLDTAAKLQKLSATISAMEERFAPLGELAELVHGNNTFKISLTNFAIAAMLDEIFNAANQRLLPMTDGRFELHREEERTGGAGKRGLDIMVFDGNSQKSKPTRALSGGESFQASLALALGLSDVVQQTTGGIKLDTIFIDEGFGSLDSDALETALDTLRSLQGDKRAVGVISHLDQVKQQITVGFDVHQTANGSHVTQRSASL